jgi:hypothetical protein
MVGSRRLGGSACDCSAQLSGIRKNTVELSIRVRYGTMVPTSGEILQLCLERNLVLPCPGHNQSRSPLAFSLGVAKLGLLMFAKLVKLRFAAQSVSCRCALWYLRFYYDATVRHPLPPQISPSFVTEFVIGHELGALLTRCLCS